MDCLGGVLRPGISRADDCLRTGRQAEHDAPIDRRDESDGVTVADAFPRNADVSSLAGAVATRALVGREFLGPDAGGVDDYASPRLADFIRVLGLHCHSHSFAVIVDDPGDSRVTHYRSAVLSRRDSVGDR